jgi:S1-C subfamily serine protease
MKTGSVNAIIPIRKDVNDMTTLAQYSDELAALVAAAAPSIYTVNARRRLPATGIAISTTHILTVHHAVEKDQDIQVQGTPAVVAGRDHGLDLCVLTVEGQALTPAKTALALPQVGSLALALGKPGEQVEAGLGLVRAVYSQVKTQAGIFEQLIQSEANPHPGFSGGPLLNMRGEVVGINTSGLAMGALLTIPIGLALQAAHQLIQHGKLLKPYLGVRTQTVQLGGEPATGLMVMGVEEGSPAQQAGILIGDILTGLGGTPTPDHSALQAALISSGVGKAVQASLVRAGSPLAITITVGER